MMSSLCEGNLEHYFVPSNLFAGKKNDAMLEIASRVAKIQDDPVEANTCVKAFLTTSRSSLENPRKREIRDLTRMSSPSS
jgi:hypothetical protein